MCGIMGYIGSDQALQVIIDGLSRLEYRGYDSAGTAVIKDGGIELIKKKGRIANLVEEIGPFKPAAIGIGHTRWATHGVPSDRNAHPHADCNGEIVLVHNGIIENYASLRRMLEAEGHIFRSETDTETLAHLVEKHYQAQPAVSRSLEQAVRAALKQVEGSFAIVVMCAAEPDLLVAAKKDSPLIAGIGDGENYLASDIPAILGRTAQVYIMNDYEFVVMRKNSFEFTDFDGNPINKEIFHVTWDPVAAEKGGYEHFMLKEIHEQPAALKETLRGSLNAGRIDLSSLDMDDLFKSLQKVYIVACGTAYHAGLVGRLAIETLCQVPVETDIASEFRYRHIIWQPHSLMMVISQSGETADTLAALREAKRNGIPVLAVTNVVGSSVAREADQVIFTHAGPEIAVASTKAYSTQLLVMYMLALYLAEVRGQAEPMQLARITAELGQIEHLVEKALLQEENIRALAAKYKDVHSTFFLGRGLDYAVAQEGALKLKEIAYVYAEAYAAGELKHGPLALIDEGIPVLALITQDQLVDKAISNIKEVKARGAVVISICKENLQEACQESDEIILLPECDPMLTPLVAVLPLQIFAYYMAVMRGTDVDKPKNLAKSVTVE